MTKAAYQNETREQIDPDRRELIDRLDFAGADAFFKALTSMWDMRGWRALDMFARDGKLTVERYCKTVGSLDLWEFNPEHEDALKAFNCGEVRIGDSYELIHSCGREYDFLMVDTPQGQYPAMGQIVTEHFDFLPLMEPIMAPKCVVAFYVNKHPYDRNAVGDFGNDSYTTYDFQKWMEARQNFYHALPNNSEGEVLEHEALFTYGAVFEEMGYAIHKVLITPCHDGYDGLPSSFRCALELRSIR